MVLELLAIASIPTTIGVTHGIASQTKEKGPALEAERLRKFTLECYCKPNSPAARAINGGKVVLRNGKLYINQSMSPNGHAFEGFYISYPDPDRPLPLPLGMVSSIGGDPPLLNWIYVDTHTREVKYGNRTQSRKHIVGSWSWDAGAEGDAGGVTLAGKEGAVAVDTEEGWEMRWEDENGDVRKEGKTRLQISLERNYVELTGEDKEAERRSESEYLAKQTDANYTMTGSKLESKREMHKNKARTS
ncbi:hypothetical protein P7C71_g2898, partial [Lecanoromycetidae sp. Uapishka_2]